MTSAPDPNRDLLHVPDIADELGVSTRHVSKLLRDGAMRGARVGRAWRVRRAWLDEYLERNADQNAAAAPAGHTLNAWGRKA